MTDAFPTERLRPVLEAAVRVAREGEEADPIEPAPAPLRRYLHFARLPSPALAAVRRVLEGDTAFRRRVADAADAGAVGEPGWLWLTRPHGWEDRLAELAAELERQKWEAEEDQAEQSARRRLATIEEARRRAEAAVEEQAASARRARDELDAERFRRREAELKVTGVSDELELARQDAQRLRDESEAARAELSEARQRLEAARRELEGSRAWIAELAARQPVDEGHGADGPDRAVLAATVKHVVDASARLSEALAALSALVSPPAAASEPPSRRRPVRPARPSGPDHP
ncbi:MAG: hypothetical protein ACRD29_16600, partial [Acidimicrobiales bacterium]